jgi:hypothetical protein
VECAADTPTRRLTLTTEIDVLTTSVTSSVEMQIT